MGAIATRPGERLYEQVAGRVRDMILQRTYRAGDRLPSVRELSKAMNVSITTVLDAYRLLEDQGYIHPRAQSGHYVKARPLMTPSEPERTAPMTKPADFSREDMLRRMIRDWRRPEITALAFASPNPELLPHAKLSRLLGKVSKEHPHTSYAYGAQPGFEPLREQIAQRAFEAGVSVSPDDIVITCGCQEALYLSLLTVCKPGGVVAVESPSYYGVLQAIQHAGMRIREICTRPRGGMCLDDLEIALAQSQGTPDAIQAVLVCSNYSNPLGGQMSELDKQRLAQIAARFGVAVIEDDVYGDLGYEDARPSVAKAYDDADNILLCSSFSKTIAPGFRVGWVVSKRHQETIERLKYATNIAVASLPQMVIAEFLSNGGYDHYLRRARKVYSQNVEIMSDAVARYFPEGTRMTRPVGGFVLWVELPEHIDTLSMYQTAVDQRIAFAPGALFSTHDSFRNFMRLSAARWSPRVEEAVARLGRLAKGRV